MRASRKSFAAYHMQHAVRQRGVRLANGPLNHSVLFGGLSAELLCVKGEAAVGGGGAGRPKKAARQVVKNEDGKVRLAA